LACALRRPAPPAARRAAGPSCVTAGVGPHICAAVKGAWLGGAGVIQMNAGIMNSLFNQRYFRDNLSTWRALAPNPDHLPANAPAAWHTDRSIGLSWMCCPESARDAP